MSHQHPSDVDNNLLKRFLSTDEFLRNHLLAFLTTNDVTNLSMTCLQLRDIISFIRRKSFPYIVWEKRIPTKIGYGCRDEQGQIMTVQQVQQFRFICRNSSEEKVQVRCVLINEVWDEHDNNRDGRRCRNLNQFPSATRFAVVGVVVGPHQQSDQNDEHRPLFKLWPPHSFRTFWNHNHDRNCKVSFKVKGHRSYHVVGDSRARTPAAAAQEAIRTAMDLVWKCAQHVAAFPDGTTAYPSAEYLMQTLPRWLHPYFPDSFAITADPARRHPPRDRETVVEFTYRPARTLAEWDAFLPPRFSGTHLYSLQEVPWYRNGYSWVEESNGGGEEEEEGE